MDVLLIITLVLGLGAVVGGFYWATVGLRARRAMEDRPTVRRGLELPAPTEGWPTLSIIIPAHNERRVIEKCARSLLAQDYSELEIIFVLDRCTDDTAERLRSAVGDDPRVRIIENDSCPDDWAGKCNAARLGAEHATGDWLLFTDADTHFDPQLCKATVALAMHRNLALLSLLSTLTHEHHFERMIQPVAALALLKIYPIERVNRSVNARAFANGQFMLFNRTWYERIGGHASVRDDLLEDIAFARKINESGGRGGIALADGLLTVSMYESIEALRLGWKRIFIEACKRKPRRLRKYAWRMLFIGVLLTAGQLTAAALALVLLATGQPVVGVTVLAVAAVSMGIQLSVLGRIYPLGGAPRSAVLLYPVGAFNVVRILFSAASDLEHRRPVKWGGREYVLEPR